MNQYTLTNGWNRASDGKSIVATIPQPDLLDRMLIGSGALAIAAALAGGGAVAIGFGVTGTGLELTALTTTLDRVPVYQDHRPRYVH